MGKVLGIPTCIVSRGGLLRDGLRRLLQETAYDPIYCGASISSDQLKNLPFDQRFLVILSSDSIEDVSTLRKYRGLDRRCRVVVLFQACSKERSVEEFGEIADAFLSATISIDLLIKSLDLVMAGVSVIPSELIALISHSLQHTEIRQSVTKSDTKLGKINSISQSEMLVLQRLMKGVSNKLIARDLGIAEATVKAHVKAIFRKACVHNRTQVALWAMKWRLDGEGRKSDSKLADQADNPYSVELTFNQMLTKIDARTVVLPGVE